MALGILDHDDSDDGIFSNICDIRKWWSTTLGRLGTVLSERKGKRKKRTAHGRTIEYYTFEIDGRSTTIFKINKFLYTMLVYSFIHVTCPLKKTHNSTVGSSFLPVFFSRVSYVNNEVNSKGSHQLM